MTFIHSAILCFTLLILSSPGRTEDKAPPSFNATEGIFRNMVPVQEKVYPVNGAPEKGSKSNTAAGDEVHGLFISIKGAEKTESITVTEVRKKKRLRYELRRQDQKNGRVRVLSLLEYESTIKQVANHLTALKDLAQSEPENCTDGRIEFMGGPDSFKAGFCVGAEVPGAQEAIARKIFTRFNYMLTH